MNVLNPNVAKRKWTAEEDKKLLDVTRDVTERLGAGRWTEVARLMPGRTDNQVSTHGAGEMLFLRMF